MSLYRDSAVVLRTYRLGEADRIVVLLTRDNGKVRAVAKGVRKTKSRFGARLEPASHVQAQLYRGRDLDVVTQAETVEAYPKLRQQLGRLGRAVSMLEAADQLTLEREPNPQLFALLTGALRSLAGNDPALVLPAFFMKLLTVEGVGPQVHACVECDREEPLVAWDTSGAGLRCPDHRSGLGISQEAVEMLQEILGGRLASALGRPASAATAEVSALATSAVEHHLERRLRSVGVLGRS